MKNVIVCGGGRGSAVVFGQVEEVPKPGEAVTIYNARMVLYWPSECGGLFGLAANGPKKGTRITHTVLEVTDVCHQVLAVPDEVAARLSRWPAYEG